MKSNTAITFLSCGIGFGGYVAGLFGMNLDNTIFLQHIKHVFNSVCIITGGLIVFTFIAALVYIKNVEVSNDQEARNTNFPLKRKLSIF